MSSTSPASGGLLGNVAAGTGVNPFAGDALGGLFGSTSSQSGTGASLGKASGGPSTGSTASTISSGSFLSSSAMGSGANPFAGGAKSGLFTSTTTTSGSSASMSMNSASGGLSGSTSATSGMSTSLSGLFGGGLALAGTNASEDADSGGTGGGNIVSDGGRPLGGAAASALPSNGSANLVSTAAGFAGSAHGGPGLADTGAPVVASPYAAKRGALQQQPATAKLSKDEQQQVNSLLQAWESRLWEQARSFESLATEALAADAEVAKAAAMAKDLGREQADLQAKQKVAATSMDQIWEQQEALGALLAGLEETLQLGPKATAEDGKWSEKAEQRSQTVSAQLEEMSRQVDLLAEETRDFQAARYSQPLDRVAHILDAHSSELDAVQARLEATELRLNALASPRF